LRPGMRAVDVDTEIYRPAQFIERANNNLSHAMLGAAVLGIAALIAFLGSWRATLVAVVSIALSLATAGLVFYLLGINFNMMVVAGLLMAVMVVVDDSIVDFDNFRRRLQERTDAKTLPHAIAV